MELRPRGVASAVRVRELVDSAFATRYYDLEATLRTASMAVTLAEEKRSEMSADLLAAAWTEYGNALRISRRYQEAERALERATSEPATDPYTKTHLLEVKATLYRCLRRFDEARDLLLSAIEIQKSIGNLDGEGRHHNHLGIMYFESGDLPEALDAYQASLKFLRFGSSVDALVMTGHNLLETMIADGRLSAAASALALLEPFYRNVTSARLAAKIEWARARLCREQGHLPAAQLAFERAHEHLLAEPKAPELPNLLKEMAELNALMGDAAE